jgi:hypothetical protein
LAVVAFELSHMQRPDADPAYVCFGGVRLFVGSSGCHLKERVSGVVNCAAEVANLALSCPTLRLELKEVSGELLVEVEDAVLNFVREHVAKGPVLIHCAAGKSRSVSVALLVLHRLENVSLKEGFRSLYRLRPCIEPNSDLWGQLVELTHASKALSQDDCKFKNPQSATFAKNLTATSGSELHLLFERLSTVRSIVCESDSVSQSPHFFCRFESRHFTFILMVLLMMKPFSCC